MKGKLILTRHHASDWNMQGLWQGERDRHLTEYGFKKSADMGFLIKDMHIDQAFASMLVRSIETLSCMLNTCERYEVPTEHAEELNERDYGDYTGKNKWDMEKLIGEEAWNNVRRGWDYPVPNGETLRMVYDRAVPFYLHKIVPCINDGKNTLVVAHGNSLRAIIKYIETISDEGIEHLEIPFGTVLVYDIDDAGRMISKEVRTTPSEVPA